MTDIALQPAQTTSTTCAAMPRVSTRWLTVASVAQLLSRFVAAVMGAVLAAVLARSLGASEFGVYSLIMALSAIALSVADGGTSQLGVRDMSAQPEQRDGIAAALIGGQTLVGLALAPIVLLVALTSVHGADNRLACVLFIIVLPLAGIGELQVVAQARLRPDIYSIVTLSQSAVWLGSVILLGSLHSTLPSFAVAYLGSLLVQYGVLLALTRTLVRPQWQHWRSTAFRLYKKGLPLGLAGLFVLAYYKVDGILLFHYKGPATSGMYAAGYRFLDALQFIPATLIVVLNPLMSRIWAAPATTRWRRDLPRIAFTLLACASGVVCVGGVILSGPITSLIYGARYSGAAPLLSILMLSFPAICLGWFFGTMLITGDRLRPYLVVTLTAAALNLGANVALLPRFGASAAAWTTVGTEWFVVVSLALVTSRTLGIVPPISRALTCLAALGVASGAGLITARFGLIPSGLSIVVAFAAAAALLRLLPASELRDLLSKDTYIDV
jgi:O-antigen/teichoic acid export membrane protein